MKRLILILALVAGTLASCTKEEFQIQEQPTFQKDCCGDQGTIPPDDDKEEDDKGG